MFLDNRDCIPSHQVDLPMPAVGAFGEIEGGLIAGKADLFGNTFSKLEGLLGCVAAERRLDRSSQWRLWQQYAR